MSQDVTLKKKTIRSGDLVLPMHLVHMVIQSVDREQDMTPVIQAGNDTVLVIRIPGKKAEQMVLDWIAEKERGQVTIPPIPPPPSTPGSCAPLLHFDPE